MAQKIKDVMTPDPITVSASATLTETARKMKDADVGPVIVLNDDGAILGIVTDRDIAIRAVAEGKDPDATAVGEICSEELETLAPNDRVADAIRLMREKAIRRIPVVEGSQPVGIVSIGDLAIERDPDSALADISAAPPNE
jgi:CBS domain-containing protein